MGATSTTLATWAIHYRLDYTAAIYVNRREYVPGLPRISKEAGDGYTVFFNGYRKVYLQRLYIKI